AGYGYRHYYPYGLYAGLWGLAYRGYAGFYYPYSSFYPVTGEVTAAYYDPAVPLFPEEPDTAPVPETPPRDGAAPLRLRVPADAELWFDGTKTRQTGPEREFASPVLEPGKTYNYTVMARWKEDGRPVERKRTLQVRADMWAAVDLTEPETPPMPKVP